MESSCDLFLKLYMFWVFFTPPFCKNKWSAQILQNYTSTVVAHDKPRAGVL
jgi:hypothetical protein